DWKRRPASFVSVGRFLCLAAVECENARARNGANQPAQVATVRGKVSGECLESRRVGPFERQVVDRFDERPTEHQRPDAIDRRAMERSIVRMSDPLRQSLPPRALLLTELLREGDKRCDRFSRRLIEILKL